MKTLAIIGGKLQGFEVTYLAKKAGINVLLIDKHDCPLIRGLVDEFDCFDVTENPEKLIEISQNVDAILPVNENQVTINFLETTVNALYCPLIFDFDAYRVSNDKKKSKEYFKSIGVPTPMDYPCRLPCIIKPLCESSSIGVSIIHDYENLDINANELKIIEEFIEGDVISLEIVGDGRHFSVVKETKVHTDEKYDCHMVTPFGHNSEFRKIAYNLASNLKLKGIMDVEAIKNSDDLRIIEIDARFPSQTPIVVYHSTGINLLVLLMQAFSSGVQEIETVSQNNYCILEHIMLKNGQLIPVDEQILSNATNYSWFYNSEGLEIFKCYGDYPAFTMITWGIDELTVDEMRDKGFFIIKNKHLNQDVIIL
ncbi:MAG: 3-methylornithine--L-lysine ligase PylC [Methanohalobium sp.]|uniref:3-methylornithine--L-lysine ligase PylC n=1 Tax=Methanohalobium sp. TaxID=2837493 RepID=UPI003978A0AF